MNVKDKNFKSAVEIVKRLRKHGFSAYFVGGCVRDLLMKREAKDFDIATDALAEQTEEIFKNTRPIGKQFGVILVIHNKIPFEVATFRVDEGYSDGRRPDKVVFGTAQMDALRRDFTINGLLYDPIKDEIIDYIDGAADIKKKVIKAIGDPSRRFEEDKLRMLRAVRFASTLGFTIEKETLKAISKKASQVSVVSSERIRDELVKMMTGPYAYEGLKILDETGLLKIILPSVEDLKTIKQPPQFHPTPNAFEHTRLLFKYLKDPTPRVAMAALLHDIGKAKTMTKTDRIRFNNHDNVGASMAKDILKGLRFPNDDIKLIVRYIKNHMKFIEVTKMRESTLKKFLGQENFKEEIELHKADCLASHKNIENYDFCNNKLKTLSRNDLKPDSKIKGKDLISLGFVPGPKFKKILDFAYNEQLEDKKTTKLALLQLIKIKYPLN